MDKRTIKRTIEKVKEIVKRMYHGSEDDVKETIKVSDKLSLEVNCIRGDEDSDYLGEAFEVYAVKNGVDEDCASFDFLDVKNDAYVSDIEYLLNCWG